MNHDLIDGAVTSLRELIALEHKKIETQEKLLRLLLIAKAADLDPKSLTGKVGTSIHTYGRPLWSRPWLENEFVVRLDGEEVARKKLIDVPTELWPDDIREEYERVQRRKARNKEETR